MVFSLFSHTFHLSGIRLGKTVFFLPFSNFSALFHIPARFVAFSAFFSPSPPTPEGDSFSPLPLHKYSSLCITHVLLFFAPDFYRHPFPAELVSCRNLPPFAASVRSHRLYTSSNSALQPSRTAEPCLPPVCMAEMLYLLKT